MTTDYFVVSQKDSAWQFSFRGNITAPLTTKDEAIAAAIAAAGKVDGAEVAVLLRDGDLHTETIWRSGQVNLTDRESANLAADLERGTDA